MVIRRREGLIINRPDRVSHMRKGAWGAVTLAAWLLYVWLLIPLITLLLWALGVFTTFDSVITVLPSINSRLLIFIAISAAVAATALMVWAEVNRRRFHDLERREREVDVPVQEIADLYDVPERTMYTLQTSKHVWVGVSPEGWPAHARSGGAKIE